MDKPSAHTVAHSSGQLKRWLILLIVCAVIIAILGALKYLQITKAIAFAESFPERSETVTAITAKPISWSQTYQTIGDIKPTKHLELRTEVDGKISNLGFIGGATVKAGQLLLQLDSTEEQVSLRATQAQLKLAEIQLQRMAELRANKLTSDNDYDLAEAERNILIANVAALKAVIDKKNLVAPFAAKTGLHNLQRGQYLKANSLVTELNGSAGSLWVDFKLPQDQANLAIGERIAITAKGLSDEVISAQVISADAQINLATRNRSFRALINNAPVSLLPGAVVNIEIVLAQLNNTYKLPASAVRRNNFGAFVYVLKTAETGADADYRAERRQVSTVSTEGSTVIVDKGLKTGELIAATGAFKLQQGMLAHIADRASDITEEPAE